MPDPEGHRLTEAPPESISVAAIRQSEPLGDLLLQRPRRTDLGELMEAINSSLGEIRPWLPWARRPATEESVRDFLDDAERGWEELSSFAFVGREVLGGTTAGRDGGPHDEEGVGRVVVGCGLHARVGPGALEIGYWVRTDRTGRGVATAAARALTRTALALPGVSRVEIHCDPANVASAAIPAKLGYTLDRVEEKDPAAPAETGRLMIWVFAPESRVG